MEDTAIQSLLRAPEIDQCKKVLCIQPHPDDNEVDVYKRQGCGRPFLCK